MLQSTWSCFFEILLWEHGHNWGRSMSTVYQCSAWFSGLWPHARWHSPVSSGNFFHFSGNMKKKKPSKKGISDFTNGINLKSAWMALISISNIWDVLGKSTFCCLIEPKLNLLTLILSIKLGDSIRLMGCWDGERNDRNAVFWWFSI